MHCYCTPRRGAGGPGGGGTDASAAASCASKSGAGAGAATGYWARGVVACTRRQVLHGFLERRDERSARRPSPGRASMALRDVFVGFSRRRSRVTSWSAGHVGHPLPDFPVHTSAARASWSTASGGRAGGGGGAGVAGVTGAGGIAGGAHAMPPTPAGGVGAARARVPPRRRGAFCRWRPPRDASAASTSFVLGRRCDRRRFGGPWSSRGGDGRDTESRRSTSDGVSILTIVKGQARLKLGLFYWSTKVSGHQSKLRQCGSGSVSRLRVASSHSESRQED